MTAGLCSLALLYTMFVVSIWRTIKRTVADRARAEHATRVELFLDELTTDAAYASVADFPYAGADLLSMLERHDLITGQEIEELITDARSRLPELYVPPRNGTGAPVEDEIPF